MYEFEIKVDGNFRKIVRKFENDVAFNRRMYITMLKAVEHYKTQVKPRAPFKSGTLRRSISSNVQFGSSLDTIVGEVGTPPEVPYARLHEFGGTFTRTQAFGRPTRPYTVTYRAQRYFRNTWDARKSFIHGMFNKEIEAYMKQV